MGRVGVAPEGLAAPDVFGFELFPNPFNGLLRLTFDAPGSESSRIAVYDARGRFLEKIDGNVWDATGRPSGAYWLRGERDGRIVSKNATLVR